MNRFRLAVAGFAAALCVTISANAGDQKHDIRGFYVGMPQPEFEQHLKTNGCKTSSYQGRILALQIP
jgi:hypothetical protein